MKGLLKQMKRQRCEVIVNDEELSRMLTILVNNEIRTNLSVGEVDWGDDFRWAIAFDASLKKMNQIEEDVRTAKCEDVILLKNVRKLAELVRLP